jgi:hypothetical protein
MRNETAIEALWRAFRRSRDGGRPDRIWTLPPGSSGGDLVLRATGDSRNRGARKRFGGGNQRRDAGCANARG